MNNEKNRGQIYYISKKFKKVAIAFALTGTLGVSSIGAIATIENDIVTEENIVEHHDHLVSNTKSSTKTTKVTKKKWKKLDDKLEYRVLSDGTYITRKHNYEKVKYNKRTKRDIVECTHCGAKTTEKHSHNVESWKKNSKTKKYVGKCTECHKTVKKTKLTKQEKKLLETATKSYGGGGGGGSSSSSSYSSGASIHTSSVINNSNTSTNNTNTTNNSNTPTTPAHTHTYSGDWSNYGNANKHRRECTAHDGAYEYEEHKYSNSSWEPVDGTNLKDSKKIKNTCSKCGYTKVHTHDLELGDYESLSSSEYTANKCRIAYYYCDDSDCPVHGEDLSFYEYDETHTYVVKSNGGGSFSAVCSDCVYTKVLGNTPNRARTTISSLESDGHTVNNQGIIDDYENSLGSKNINYLKDLKASLLCYFKKEEIEENKKLTYKI